MSGSGTSQSDGLLSGESDNEALRRLAREIVQSIVGQHGYRRIAVLLVHEQALYIVAAMGISEIISPTIKLRDDDELLKVLKLAPRTITWRKLLSSDSFYVTRETAKSFEDMKAQVLVPLRVGHPDSDDVTILGTVVIGSLPESRPTHDRDSLVRTVEPVAQQMSAYTFQPSDVDVSLEESAEIVDAWELLEKAQPDVSTREKSDEWNIEELGAILDFPSVADDTHIPVGSEVTSLISEASDKIARGELQRAVDALEEALEIDPASAEAQALLAEANERLEQKQETAEIEQREQRQQVTVERAIAEAEEEFAAGRYDEAEDALLVVFELVPQHARARDLLMAIEKEQQKKRSRRQRDPAAYHRKLAEQFLEQDRLEEALSEYKKLLHAVPSDRDARKMVDELSKRLLEQEFLEKKRAEREKARRIKSLLKQGKRYFKSRDYSACIKTLSKALFLDPDNPKAEKMLRKARRRSGL